MPHYKPISAFLEETDKCVYCQCELNKAEGCLCKCHSYRKIDVTEVESMVYNPDKLVEKKVEVGKVVDDEIVQIQEGKKKDFVTDWEKYESAYPNANPNQECIRVLTTLGCRVDINLPKDGTTYSPASMLAKWERNFGKVPFVGQKIKSVVNKKGWFEVAFPLK